MRKRVLPYVILLIFAAPGLACAQQTYYRLGEKYRSASNAGKYCLEGHNGQVQSNPECVTPQPCTAKSCAELGSYYYCSKVSERCEIRECLGTWDHFSCINKYGAAGHMRTCVDNENNDGGSYCKITCNWDLVKVQGSSVMTGMRLNQTQLIEWLRFEELLWNRSSSAAAYLPTISSVNKLFPNTLSGTHNSTFFVAGLFSLPIREPMFTCSYGQMTECRAFETVSEGSTPCLTCSMLTGGKATAQDLTLGRMPYLMKTTRNYRIMTHRGSYSYWPDGKAFYDTGDLTFIGCADSKGGFLPFSKTGGGREPAVWGGTVSGKETYKKATGKDPPRCYSTASPYPACLLYGNKNGQTDGNGAVLATLDTLVYCPQQNVTAKLTGGSQVNFNAAGGTLLCCHQFSEVNARSGLLDCFKF